jgi:Cell Wall Hydrolase
MMDRIQAAHRRADRVLNFAAFIVLACLAMWTRFDQHTSYIPAPSPAPSAHIAVAALPPPAVTREEQSECLAEVLYYEARGEGAEGEKAVAEVVLQRTREHNYPRTICGVVYEGAQPNNRACQFSFACDGALRQPKDRTTWKRIRKLAEAIVSGAVKLAGETRHAIAYHKIGVQPAWAEAMVQTAQIGNHVFYRSDSQPIQHAGKPGAAEDAALTAFAGEQLASPYAGSEEIQSQVEITDAVGQGA